MVSLLSRLFPTLVLFHRNHQNAQRGVNSGFTWWGNHPRLVTGYRVACAGAGGGERMSEREAARVRVDTI